MGAGSKVGQRKTCLGSFEPGRGEHPPVFRKRLTQPVGSIAVFDVTATEKLSVCPAAAGFSAADRTIEAGVAPASTVSSTEPVAWL